MTDRRPVQQAVARRQRLRYVQRPSTPGASRQRRLHATLPRAPGEMARRAPRLSRVLHARARDGGAAARDRAERRGDRPGLHLRLDGERVRGARRGRCSSTSDPTR
jgi:hypothetical protein